MFKLNRFLAVGSLLIPAVALHAQTGYQSGTTAYVSPSGILSPKAMDAITRPASATDTMLAICNPPAQKIVRKKVVYRPRVKAAPSFTPVVKSVAPVRKKAPAPAPKPAQPHFVCPVAPEGQPLMATLSTPDYNSPTAVPMFDDTPEGDDPLPLLTSSDATPTFASAAGGNRSFAPLFWLLGSGSGAGVFTAFLHDGGNHSESSITPPDTPPITTAPEPGTLVLVGTGLVGVVGMVRRRGK